MKTRRGKIRISVRSIRAELAFILLGSLLVVFLLIGGIGYYSHRQTVFDDMTAKLTMISAQKSSEYNNCLESVERSVDVMKNHILNTLDFDRLRTDKKYEQAYMEGISQRLTDAAMMTVDVVSAYFRLEPETYGGSTGVLVTGNKRTGYISVRPTNLNLYSPSDTNHVCWYYLPVWKGSAVWTEPYANQNLNISMVSYVTPIYIDGNLKGVVGMDVSMATLKGIADIIPMDGGGALLMSAEQSLVYATDYHLGFHSAEASNAMRSISVLMNEAGKSIYRFSWNDSDHFGVSVPIRNGMTLVVFVSESEFLEPQFALLLRQAIALLVFLVFACLILLHVYKKILSPVSELTEASYRLARGELNISILYQSKNELGVLADSIRKMSVQLREYIMFIREQAKSEREAKENALSASRAKSDFLANMSHEIRTPINAVLGMDEMILRETEDSDIHRYAMNIKQAGNSLLNIVNDVLDFSKIESGKMDLLPETYDISTILVDLVAMASERAQKKDLRLELHINPSLPKMLVGDSVRIKQCILNLLTNAIKYTMQGKVVFRVDYTLESHADGKTGIWLLVSVEDTGIGIKKEDVIKLFQPFERIEEKRNRTIEGTGLGLNIVQRTLALMNSKLDVESEYGKGSTFSFVIWQDVTDVEPVGDIMESYRRRVQFMEKYTEKLVAPRARILLVDDTPINLEVIKGLLKYTKIQLDTVTSGRAALEKVRQHTYDILFIDHRMPEMDGIETLEAMQVLTDNKCLGKPCIALTANAVSGAREMYISAGFSDYLSKPVSPEKLEETIIRYLPPEYIEKPDDNLAFSSMDYDSPEEESKEDLPQIEGIDSKAGLQNCGETGLFIEMLGLVYQGIQENSDAIQSAFDQEDLDMYRIKVHSLKSTARLIGAMELSKKAADLEKAAADNDIDMIREKTADLLELYRSFSEKLAPYAPQEQDSSQNA